MFHIRIKKVLIKADFMFLFLFCDCNLLSDIVLSIFGWNIKRKFCHVLDIFLKGKTKMQTRKIVTSSIFVLYLILNESQHDLIEIDFKSSELIEITTLYQYCNNVMITLH